MGHGMNPFGDEVMTIIMGIDPTDPGMHGPLEEPCPSDDAVGLVTKIRDMCEEWLRSAGKAGGGCDEPQKNGEMAEEGDGDGMQEGR